MKQMLVPALSGVGARLLALAAMAGLVACGGGGEAGLPPFGSEGAGTTPFVDDGAGETPFSVNDDGSTAPAAQGAIASE